MQKCTMNIMIISLFVKFCWDNIIVVNTSKKEFQYLMSEQQTIDQIKTRLNKFIGRHDHVNPMRYGLKKK